MSRELVEHYRKRAESALTRCLQPAECHPARLHEAMRYAALGGGKRVRPILVYGAGRAVAAPEDRLDAPACAVELIHAYSLVHDDLPAMDDDDLRRGRPTCHKAYDEATAILVGDGLQALAFRVLSRGAAEAESAALRLRMIDILSTAAGSRGMVGGQAIDLAAVGQTLDLAQLEDMHIHKTGALIRSSVLLGALCRSGIDPTQLDRLDRYGKCIGLAFQIQDDILDVTSDTATLGKRQGADRALDKPTYVSLMGLSEARAQAAALHKQAKEALSDFDSGADLLRWLADYIVQRSA